MILNGQEHPHLPEGSVSHLLTTLNLEVAKVVVEVNGEIVPKSQYNSYHIDKAAQVEIVSFVGGG